MSEDPTPPGASPSGRTPAPAVPPLLAWLPWLAAMGFALLAGFMGQAYFSARSEASALRQQAELADIEAQSLRQQLEAERILAAHRTERLVAEALAPANAARPADLAAMRVIPLSAESGTDRSIQAVVIWDGARQEGELAVFRMPALPPGQCYRICILDPRNPEPDPAAAFSIEAPAGDARVHLKPAWPVADGARFVISSGHVGENPHASDPIVLSSR